MKRSICINHINHVRVGKTQTLTEAKDCSICKRINRPISLKDMAKGLEGVSLDMRYAHDNPDYDPFGITFLASFEDLVVRFGKAMSESYRKNFVKKINEELG